jgi:hypothetical protein
VLKTYGDFKRLNMLLLASDLDSKLPVLPQKLNEQGAKRVTASIQADLAQWLKQLLEIPSVTRMMTVKHFFVMTSNQ